MNGYTTSSSTTGSGPATTARRDWGTGGWAVNFIGAGVTKNKVKDSVIKNNARAVNDALKKNKETDPNSIADNGYGIDTGDLFGTPVITSVVISSSTLTISFSGTLTSAPNSNYSLEIFGNQHSDPVGSEQGEMFFASIQVQTDASGYGTFTDAIFMLVDPSVLGNYLSMTSTGLADDGYTSHFTAYYPVPPATLSAPLANLGADSARTPYRNYAYDNQIVSALLSQMRHPQGVNGADNQSAF